MDEFEQKIAHALNGSGHSSTELGDLLTETEQAILKAEEEARSARDAAYDPRLSRDLQSARAAMEDAAFRVGRLEILLPRLRRRYQIVVAQEQSAEAEAKAEPIRAQRDALAQEFADTYTEYADRLTDLFERMAENNAAIARLHSSLPDGSSLYLRESELEARKLASFSRDHFSILKTAVLPDIDGTMLWPPSRTAAHVMAEPPPFNPRHSQDWGRVLEEQNAQAEADEEVAIKQAADDARQRQIESGAPVWWEGEKR
jgi:hypothetical protein